MSEKTPNSNSNTALNKTESLFEYIKEDFFPRHGTKVIIILFIVVTAVFALIRQLGANAEKEAAMAEELGRGLEYMYIGKGDSALMAFESAIQSGTLNGLPLAKAALLAGNLHLQTENLDSAEIMYKLVIANAPKVELISSAAEHGLAVVAMERQNYPEAISRLNEFVNKYGKRTGNLSKRYAKTEPTDKISTVPDALWKLTLCYLETGDKEKAKQTAEKLLAIYGDSQKAADASKLLATLVEK
ncbi:MAG: tetratricopeptide repeat protein [Fibromonadaceae bacterium]|jgi:tetratricopeptide (TPR) repeat protein|nr:tetratricopeptide repeat protein [Fibromonadaceae bacterium]